MNWEQRLRDMILAGGAMVAAACSGNGASGAAQDPPDANEPTPVCCNGYVDPCSLNGPDGAISSTCKLAMECESRGGSWLGSCIEPSEPPPLAMPDNAPPDAETPDGGNVDAAPADAGASSASSLQCGGGTISGAGTDQCINAGGVCVQLPDPACCDLVPGFDPTISGCPHAPFAIRCCAVDGGAAKAATDASVE
jgi:hypothetical protein